MFMEAAAEDHRAHFHAYYQDQAPALAVDTIECLGGSLPKAQQRRAVYGIRSTRAGDLASSVARTSR